MKKFLLNFNSDYSITLFSIPHISLILLTFIAVYIVIKKKDKISKLNLKYKLMLRYGFALVLLINMIIRRGSFIYYGVYNWQNNLDINFCNFTSIIFIIYALTGNKNIITIGFHMSFVGPLLSILLPSYNLLPLSYSFISFLIIHHLIFVFSFVFIFVENLEWDKQCLPKTLEFLSIYFTIIYTFDYVFKVNYNMPLTFINNTIINPPLINKIVNNNVIVFIIYIVVIISLLLLANKILKKLTKKGLVT